MKIVVTKDKNEIVVEGNCPQEHIFEFCNKWIEGVLYLSVYQNLNASILMKDRNRLILSSRDKSTIAIFQQLFRNQWVLLTENSNIEGPLYVMEYTKYKGC